MKIVKLYQKPDKPEFYILVRSGGLGFLVNYPIHVPDTRRVARWFNVNEVYIDWVREFV